MMLGVEKRLLRPAFLLGVLAVFLSLPIVHAQSVKELPPPPPNWKPKPTPTPTPPEKEVIDVIRTTSNLVMVPVSVTDRNGQAVQGLTKTDFRLEEEGKQQEISEMGDPEQVPLEIARGVYQAVRSAIIYYAGRYYEERGHLEFVHSVTGVRTLKDEFDKVASRNEHHLGQIRSALRAAPFT